MIHRLSLDDQIRGLKKGIWKIQHNPKGPKWLIPGMRAYIKRLEKEKLRRERIRARLLERKKAKARKATRGAGKETRSAAA